MTALSPIDFEAPGGDQQFVDSLQATGFGVLKNHPLDKTLIRSIYTHWVEFFASDGAAAYAVDREHQDGFFSMANAESAKGQTHQDLKEYFHFYPWGRCPPELRDELMRYYESAHVFAATLLSWIEQYSPGPVAEAYNEPLSNMVNGSEVTLLRILHYPPISGAVNAIRAAPHEDINLITLLPMSSADGLEVLGGNDQWIPVPADFDHVVVNIGDMLQEASNGHFPSTTHRVVNPVNADMAGSRMSLPLFLHPRPDVVLSNRYTAKSYLDERLRELGVA